jgi:spore maturation protein SpmA
MNAAILILFGLGFALAAFKQINWLGEGVAPMEAVGQAMLKAAEGAASLSLGMVGAMALFLGLMKIAEAGGLLTVIARLLRPLLTRLFPEIPANHPAMGAMVFNISANFLGLGNAATPFGIRAMRELAKFNPLPGVAGNAMVMFLVINTASVTLLPTSVIVLRAAAGSKDPAGIFAPTLFATICSTVVAIIAARWLARFWPLNKEKSVAAIEQANEKEAELPPEAPPYPAWVSWSFLLGVAALMPLALFWGKSAAAWVIPSLAAACFMYGTLKRVDIYAAFIDGAREAFEVAVRIIPYLVAILVVVAAFRESGAMEVIIRPLGALTTPLGLPPEGLIMAVLRQLSGSGAFGYLASVIQDPNIGPDSYTGYLVSTIMGSTETTFYVLAVYFGAVGVKRIRHALVCGLLADLAGVIFSVIACRLMVGG